jgi:hypothetical protein
LITEGLAGFEYFDFRLASFNYDPVWKFDRASENSREALPECAACGATLTLAPLAVFWHERLTQSSHAGSLDV